MGDALFINDFKEELFLGVVKNLKMTVSVSINEPEDIYENRISINKEQAQQIIEHLKTQFQL